MLRTRYTLEFLGTWEELNNSNFKAVVFDGFKKEAGLPTFTLSVSEWVEKTNAICEANGLEMVKPRKKDLNYLMN